MAFSRGKKNKKFVGLFMLLIIVGAGGFFFFKNIKKAAAEWYDSNWFYRQAVNIANTGNAQTDFQVSITLNTSTLITAGKLQSNCNDIRVTDINGKLLPYWIETGINACNTTTTVIWTKVPSIPTSGQTVYVYYGNPNAVSAQNGNNVFLFFDDFSGSLSKWTNPAGCAATITSGYMNIPASTTCDSTPTYITGLNYSDATGYIVELRGKYTSGGSNRLQVYQRIRNANSYIARFWIAGSSATNAQEYTGSWGSNTNVGANGMSADTWYDLRAKVLGSNNTFYVNGTSIGSITSSASLTPFTDFTFGLGEYQTAVQYDDVRVRKTASTEPTNSNASEEKGPGPIAYWKFDEGQGTTAYDSSSNKNNGTLSGTTKPTWQTGDMCVSGKCLKFDGVTNYVDAGSNSVFNLGGGDFTTELWLKLNSYNASWVTGVIGNFDGNTTGWELEVYGALGGSSNQGKLGLRFNNSTGSFWGTTQLSLNTWYHISMVYTSSNTIVKFYINGTTSNADSGSVPGYLSPTVSMKIGKRHDGYLANGFIDDVKIYPYARTADQIKADYNSRGSLSGTSVQVGNQSAWMTNGLVGYWKMDETTGTSASDSSGNGNTASLANSPTWVAGKFGDGLQLSSSSSQYINMISTSNISTSNGLTASMWIKYTANTSGCPQLIGFNGNNPSGVGWFYIDGGCNSSTPYLDYAGANTGEQDISYSANLNTWYHLVVTYAPSGSLNYYVNGALVGSIAPNSNIASIQYITLANGYLNGVIDEERIYNRALSPKEVSDLYNWAPGPVGWWKMDDKVSGNSQTLVDSSTYGNTGTTHYGANTTGMNCKIIGKYGGGCLFDGVDDYASANIVATQSFTVSFWFNFRALPSFYGNVVYTGTYGACGSSGGWSFRSIGNGGPPYQALFTMPSASNACDSLFGQIQLNTWYFLTVTYDGSNVETDYINGVQMATHATGSITLTGSSIVMGSGANMILDDVKIYNYARTQKQILEDMNAGHPSVGSPVGSYAAYWKFDEGHDNTVYDMSVNTNTGTNHGASWTNDGKFNKALSFNGSTSYVDVAANTSLDLTNELTVEAWVNPSGSVSYPVIINKAVTLNSWTNFIWGLRLAGTSRKPTMLFIYSDSTDNGENLKSPSAIPNNQWSQIVVTKSLIDNMERLYVNGVQVATNASSKSLKSAAGEKIRIGAPTGDNYWLGLIDEVKIYPFALTADDVKTEYNKGSALVLGSVSNTSGLSGGSVASNSASAAYCIPGDTTPCNSPVGEWKFDENVSGNNQTLYDTSGNGNNGTTHWGANASGMNCKILGKYGTGCQFDGVDDYIDAGNGASLSPTANGITVEAWVYRTATLTGSYRWDIVAKSGWCGGSYSMGIDSPTNNVEDYVTVNGSCVGMDGSLFPMNQWVHEVMTAKAGGKLIAYINGIDVAETTLAAGTLNDNSNSLKINGYSIGQDVNPANLQGIIDNVTIYNYARTPAQVAWDYNRGGPVGWWKMDECQGTIVHDASGNGNTGTITIGGSGSQTTTGTCTTPTDGTGAWHNGKIGRYNSAMSFDGTDDYVALPSTASLYPTQFTISSWVNTNTLTAGDSNLGQIIFSNYEGNKNFIFYISNTGLLCIRPHDGSTNYNLCSSSALTVGNWYFASATFDGTNLIIYINGISKGNRTATNLANQNNYAAIGMGPAAGGYYFNGIMDDIKLYNYALTPFQIKLDYNQGSAVRFGPQPPWACGNSVSFTYKGSSVTYGTVSHNGMCWMDRNLGASEVATSYNDSNAYGDLFQWGRLDDGHQTRTSGTTTNLSGTDVPGNSNFIYGMGSPTDWRSPQGSGCGGNSCLWQGVSGVNNPCPSGWGIPTQAELTTEYSSWSSQDGNGAFASPLKLPEGGYRDYTDALLNNVGNYGTLWSSTVSGTSVDGLTFGPGVNVGSAGRAWGESVRCVQNP